MNTIARKNSLSEAHAAAPTPLRRRFSPAPFAMIGLLIVLIVVFSALRPTTFATAANASTILLQNAVLAVLALGVMLPLIVNEFDLSLASVMGFAAMLTAGLPVQQGLPVPLVLLVVLAMGALVGLLHAVLIVRLGLPSFVVTLGTNSVLTGVILVYSGGAVFYQTIPQAILFLGTGQVLGIPMPVVLMAVLVLVLWYVLEQRPLGRRLYAVGANEPAARLAGIRTGRLRAGALIAAGVIAAFAGVLLTATTGSASPTSYTAFFLPAFAAAYLSLAVFKIGHYNALGVAAAVYLLAVGVSGLSLLGAPSWIQPIFNGVALVVAIGLSRLFTMRSARHR